jgi:hypothetical protein
MGALRQTVAGCLLAMFLPLGSAAAEKVDLELILAVDISGSVDAYEARLQRQGYLRALVHPTVIRAITSGERRRIAVTYVEWAGVHYQRAVVDWTVVRDAASARAFAARIARAPPMREYWTSISGVIDFSLRRFAANPHKGTRRVLDISGDGPNNSGRQLGPARARALKMGIVINGLPIVNNRPQPWGGPPPRNLDRYYAQKVIGGPGSFVIVARGFKDFGRAVRIKLVREIAGGRFLHDRQKASRK